jgi:hypothetical protein
MLLTYLWYTEIVGFVLCGGTNTCHFFSVLKIVIGIFIS